MIEAGTGQDHRADAYIAAGTGQHGITGGNAQLTLHRILAGAGVTERDATALVNAVAAGAVTDAICTVQEIGPGPECRRVPGYEDGWDAAIRAAGAHLGGTPSGSPTR
ncbi:hypothetical protein BIV57_00195 [Mangrovactinospora gilvigrisea]|uniref:Uncharacterized protein n=1 Tax=Mangrovactinospora gilvigrisea TaxID=1428644 RepID=A0A1J7CCN8_9ACTN|nr:hypothetical protein [Mangrovactinospora gilvigrisea]OIV39308.1 hypothetical protein BIV57_00195 [Mangrovactinospora gilvigrisea]